MTAIVGTDSSENNAQIKAILESFCQRIVFVGKSGSGHAVKSINNALLAANLLSATEGLIALAKFGVTPDLALSAINYSSGSSKVTLGRFPDNILNRKFDYGFSLSLHCKDVDTATRFIASQSSPSAPAVAPILSLTHSLMEVSRRELGDSVDHVEVVRSLEKWNGGVVLATAAEAGDAQSSSQNNNHVSNAKILTGGPHSLLAKYGIKLVVCDMAGTTVDEGGLIYKLLEKV